MMDRRVFLGGFGTAALSTTVDLRKAVAETQPPAEAVTTISVPDVEPTLEAALRRAAALRAAPGAITEIVLAPGRYDHDRPVVLREAFTDQVRIRGAEGIVGAINAVETISGPLGAYAVTLAVDDVEGVEKGAYAIVYDTKGTGPHEVHQGCWEIIDVDGSGPRITLLNTCQHEAISDSSVERARFVVLRTVLKFRNCDGVRVEGTRLRGLQDVAIVGDRQGAFCGLACAAPDDPKVDQDPSRMGGLSSITCSKFVGVNGFGEQGVVADGGSFIYARYVVSSNNGKRGFYSAVSSGIQARNAVGTGNGRDGAIADYGSALWASIGVWAGNGAHGLCAFNGGNIIADRSACVGNAQNGGDAQNGWLSLDRSRLAYNKGDGISLDYGAGGSVRGAVSSNNGRHGINLRTNASVRSRGFQSVDNRGCGIAASASAQMPEIEMVVERNAAGACRCATLARVAQFPGTTFDGPFDVRSGALSSGNHRIFSEDGKMSAELNLTSAGDLAIVAGKAPRLLIKDDGGFHPIEDAAADSGRVDNRWRSIFSERIFLGDGAAFLTAIAGSPEGVVSAPVGSVCTRTDGAPGSTLYVKEKGSGSTGWVAK